MIDQLRRPRVAASRRVPGSAFFSCRELSQFHCRALAVVGVNRQSCQQFVVLPEMGFGLNLGEAAEGRDECRDRTSLPRSTWLFELADLVVGQWNQQSKSSKHIVPRALGGPGQISYGDSRTSMCAMGFQLVIGNGPAGAATARLLAGQGSPVRVVSRSSRPDQPGIDHVALDATDSGRLIEVAEGATVIYNCACPPYHRWMRDWPPLAASVNAAAEATGAVLVVLSNLYGYGPVDGKITENLPLVATGDKGRTRASVWTEALDLHEQGRIRVVEVRASDFFGPGVTDGGHLADRVLPQLLHGRTVRVMGDPDTPHSWTYLPDVARTLVRVAGMEDAWGRPWHVPTAPPLSIRAMVEKLAKHAEVGAVAVRRLPAGMLRVLALVSPLLRELKEVQYQFDRPFVVDSSAYTARFDEDATPIDEQIRATVDWWRQRRAIARRTRGERSARNSA